ncbi:MAG TPA: universal stress protein [Thermoanaerobaculia bacterium]|nr:universal stress protein [Thermoanaerobaculia bacterium]
MIDKFATILIGTSLNEASDPVVQSGVLLARRAGAKIHLAHAYAPPMTYGGAPFFPDFPMGEVFKAERAALQRQLDVQIERLGIDRTELAGIHLEVSPAHRHLIDTAREIGADLIVVGSSESPRLAKIFGSTADRVVRKAFCPVLVVRSELKLPLERVFLPVDLSPLSAEAFEAGMRFLVWIDAGASSAVEALFVLTELDREALSAQATGIEVEELADQELKRFVNRHAAGFPWKVETLVEPGFVDTGILDRIETWKPDLAVLGTHGRSGFERFVLGSVASTVIRGGECNLLIIPPQAARHETSPAEVKTAEEVVV